MCTASSERQAIDHGIIPAGSQLNQLIASLGGRHGRLPARQLTAALEYQAHGAGMQIRAIQECRFPSITGGRSFRLDIVVDIGRIDGGWEGAYSADFRTVFGGGVG